MNALVFVEEASEATEYKIGDEVIYIIRRGDSVKIGRTTDLVKRLLTLQTANCGELRVVRTLAGDAVLEKRLHVCFRGSRQRGEWFELSEQLKEFIEKTAPLEAVLANAGIGWLA